MNDLSTNKNNVEEIHNSLVQSQEKATKNAKNVKKEEKKAEKEHTTNEKKIEAKENELEAIKQQQAQNSSCLMSVNLLLTCSRCANIGGIQKDEKKS